MHTFLNQAQANPGKLAILDYSGSYNYGQILAQCSYIRNQLDAYKLLAQPIALLTKPGFDYVSALWAIWASGNIAVPLCEAHPDESIKYVLQDTGCSLIVVDKHYASRSGSWGLQKIVLEHKLDHEPLVDASRAKSALILYTSGTTSKPKGVVIDHSTIEAQIKSLSTAWAWDHHDYIINVLPLHHVHGIVNVVSSAFYHGATCHFLDGFDAKNLFELILRHPVNVFMAVPTIYYQLIQYWEQCSKAQQQELSTRLSSFRLMVSGSAALPEEVLDKWLQISGQVLLERYGMTEIGMALSNSYHDIRHAGHVGQPLPGVSVKLMEQGNEVKAGEPGEIWVKGPSVFERYWNRPDATQNSFEAGWFKTGDIARLTDKGYKILGRSSTDIIKSGGYKISALEIEDVLLKFPTVNACGVVGIEDPQWGEVICAALVGPQQQQIPEIEQHLLTYLPAYKKPRNYVILDQLPRNVLGKITKPKLKQIMLDQLA